MKEESLCFESEGARLAAVLHLPRRKAPGIILCHGAGGHKLYHKWEADPLVEAGFAVLRFDFRGCGESEGQRGLIKPSHQIEDLKNAVTYLRGRGEVEGESIGVCGHSLGGAVALAVSSEDRRIKAVVSVSAPSNLSPAFRGLPAPADLERLLALISRDKVSRAYGKPSKLSLAEMPTRQRRVCEADLQAAAALLSDPLVTTELLVESLEDLLTFRPIDVVEGISPTPVLFIHGEEDATVDVEEARELYRRAGEPKELRIVKGAGHAIPVEEINPLLVGWFRNTLLGR